MSNGKSFYALLALSLVAGPVMAQRVAKPVQNSPHIRAIDSLERSEDRLGRGHETEEPIQDNASARRKAHQAWFGGEWSLSYRQFLMLAATQERQRYASLMPRSGDVELAAAANGTNWINIGPTNANVIRNGSSSLNEVDSGRPRAILVHPSDPNTLYLATAGGGVWKTTNGGSSWTAITETVGSLSCGSLVMDPANPSVLHLGLGDPFDGTGVGVLKSTDGGATWSAPVFLGSSTKVIDLAVNPQNSNIILAATDKGLFRSIDGGASYAAVTIGTTVPKVWKLDWALGTNLIATLEANPGTSTPNGQIWVSSDAGATWTQATGVTATGGLARMSLAVAPGNRQVAYAMASDPSGLFADIFKTQDGGLTWTALGCKSKSLSGATGSLTSFANLLGDSNAPQGSYNHALVVDRTNPDIVYAGGQLSLIKSTNGGTSWSVKSDWLAQGGLPYVHADFHVATLAPNGTLYVGTDGGIFRSTDAGTTWTSTLNKGITSHLIYSVGSTPASANLVVGGFQDNGTRVRSGSTTTFDQQIGGDGFGAVAHQVNGTSLLGSLYYARVYKSTNSGSSFSSASTGITESNDPNKAPFNTKLALGPADATGNTVYTFTNGKVYKSTNFAGSWTAMGTSGLPAGGTNASTDPADALYIRNVAAAKSNASVVGLVGNRGRVYLTANAGSTWTAGGALPNSGSYLSSLAFDPTNYNNLYVTSVAPDATKSHIWKSGNFGSSWTAIDGNGLPQGVPINVVAVDPGDANVLYAGTQLGLYRSADAGATWTRFGAGMPLVSVMDLYVSSDSSLVRVATYGRGFWELSTQPSVAVSLTPTSATLNPGGTQQFNAAVTGTTNTSVTWTATGGTVSASGLYTAPSTTGNYTVRATSVADTTKFAEAQVQVNPVQPVSVSITPTTATLAAGATQQFNATVTGTSNTGVTWTTTGGTVSGTGLYTAPNAAGTYAVRATSVADTTKFAEAQVTVSTVLPKDLILNGSFESGTTNWTATTGTIGTFASQPAYAGTKNLWLGGTGKTSTKYAYQTVTIPSTLTSATLSFYLHIDTAESGSTIYDKLTVTVRNSANSVLKTLATYSNVNAASGYVLKTFDLSAYKGQTVRIYFNATEDSSLQTSFVIDNVSLAIR